jgi:hypothetical protein
MLKKLSQVSILTLFLSLVPLQVQSASAVEVLWNPGVGNSQIGAATGLVPGAGIRNTGLLVYKENPDELIMKIIMNDSFEDKPFTGKGRNMAMWIYWPKNYCWSKDTANCDGLFTVGDPVNPSSYPISKSSEYVVVQKHNKASNVDIKSTECKAPWWIESTYNSRDTWAFAVSITCLGMPKEFGWYAFSQIDLGQKDVVSDFTAVQTITYPFHELAASAAKKPQTTATTSDGKQVCVTAITGAGYETNGEVIVENCSQTNSWELTLCVAHPKSDLQALRNKKWQKIKTLKTSKDTDCGDDESPYSFTIKSSSTEKLRVKSYGNEKKFNITYTELRVSRKVPI